MLPVGYWVIAIRNIHRHTCIHTYLRSALSFASHPYGKLWVINHVNKAICLRPMPVTWPESWFEWWVPDGLIDIIYYLLVLLGEQSFALPVSVQGASALWDISGRIWAAGESMSARSPAGVWQAQAACASLRSQLKPTGRCTFLSPSRLPQQDKGVPVSVALVAT